MEMELALTEKQLGHIHTFVTLSMEVVVTNAGMDRWSLFHEIRRTYVCSHGNTHLRALEVKTVGYRRKIAHPVSYTNVFKTDSRSDTDS
jgi:hypothetical protein